MGKLVWDVVSCQGRKKLTKSSDCALIWTIELRSREGSVVKDDLPAGERMVAMRVLKEK